MDAFTPAQPRDVLARSGWTGNNDGYAVSGAPAKQRGGCLGGGGQAVDVGGKAMRLRVLDDPGLETVWRRSCLAGGSDGLSLRPGLET